jgi:hypothetical protein
MNKRLFRTASLALLGVALPLITACGAMDANKQATEPGAVAVETTQLTATVKAVNRRNRTLTLAGRSGKRFTYKVSKAAVNFDQIRVGDRVNVTLTEAIAVYLQPKGTPEGVGEGTVIALAPKGAMPGGLVATTTAVTARVVSVDAATRHAVLQLPDGRKKTVSVGPHVDLAKVAPGDAVTAQIADELAISVEKPAIK